MVGIGLAVAILVAALDQLVKLGIVALFADRPPGYAIDLSPFFDLQMNRNSGITWGLFNNGATANALIFSALAAAVVMVLINWLRRVDTRFLAIAIGFIIGGAAGNVIDRLMDGSVVDFLDFHLGAWHFPPTFNIADSAIFLGVVAMLLDGLVFRRSPRQAKEPGDLA
ncbi:MAG TPA: signal peptidase II [Stellaceae bacterium]|jgi:signal peptidase II|nr:signal peptidase II [Stellaceae bacterium]